MPTKTEFEKLPKKYRELLSVLRNGSDTALSSTELEKITGISRRDIGLITADLIKQGYKIGSSRKSPFGYYFIVDEEELAATLGAFRNEIFGILSRYTNLYNNFYTIEQPTADEPETISMTTFTKTMEKEKGQTL